ncbi:MAG: hypothetical protein ACTHL4_13085, partial [Flexivirga sp.]
MLKQALTMTAIGAFALATAACGSGSGGSSGSTAAGGGGNAAAGGSLPTVKLMVGGIEKHINQPNQLAQDHGCDKN